MNTMRPVQCAGYFEGVKKIPADVVELISNVKLQYAHFTKVAPQVNPPPNADRTILSPLFS